jgi:hypothetical protein
MTIDLGERKVGFMTPYQNSFTLFNINIKVMSIPMIIAGTAIPAIRLIPTGAPTNVPSCHKSFFFRDHGFLPQNVQPDGLQAENYIAEQFIL